MTYTERAIKYAEDVLSGDIPACEHVKNACQRFFDDLDREYFDYYYSEFHANKFCSFVEKLPHTKGRWAQKSELLKLSPHQIFIWCNVFGWVDENEKRRFKEAYVRLPRKDGKSLIASGIGLYMLVNDDEFGAEVYSGATTEKQAFEVFRPAKQIAERDADFREYFDVEVNAKSLAVVSNGSKFEPLIGKPGDGASPSCAIADEYHEHKDNHLVESMITGMASRENPLMVYITTAGDNLSGPCKQKDDEVIDILRGDRVEETTFGIIYTIDEGDEWDSIEAIRKANPNIGVTTSEKYLIDMLEKAKNSPRLQASFRTKHLNEWVGAMQSWMNMGIWSKQSHNLSIEDFVDYPCHVATDLSSKKDATSISILFKKEDDYFLFNKFFVPEAAKQTNKHYQQFAASGDMEETAGARVNLFRVEEYLTELHNNFNVISFAFDPHIAESTMQAMDRNGANVIEYRAIWNNFNMQMKELEALVLDGRFYHEGNKAMNWMMANVMAKSDNKGNIFPVKSRQGDESCKIDGPVSAIMAMGRWMADDNSFDMDSLIDSLVVV